MMKWILPCVGSALFFICLGCKTASASTSPGETASISYSKGPCFGFCPQFRMDIFPDGRVVYEGVKNTARLGTYSSQISTQDYKKVVRWFKKNCFDTLPEAVNLDIMDAPTTTLRYNNKTTKTKGTPPPAFRTISDSLNQLILKLPWTLIVPAWDDHIIPQEIIVQLQENISVQTWIKDFAHFGLYLKQTVSPTNNIHVVSFQAAQYDPKKVFTEIYYHKKVKKVEFNRSLDLR